MDDPAEYIADETEAKKERQRLFALIERFVKWENGTDEGILNEVRLEIARSISISLGKPLTEKPTPQQVQDFLVENAPPVLDPFCGGGSIPLAAHRFGLRTFASDLNPVAVLITKALVEIPEMFAGKPPVNWF